MENLGQLKSKVNVKLPTLCISLSVALAIRNIRNSLEGNIKADVVFTGSIVTNRNMKN